MPFSPGPSQIGASREKPNWLRLKGGMGRLGLSKKFFASSFSFRKNSNASPWNWFEPERVAMLTMAPLLRPYSALKVELSALNSETVLIDGWKVI